MSLKTVWQQSLIPYRARKSSTVRYAFPMLLVTSLLLTATVINKAEEATVSIHMDNVQVRVGETVTAEIRINTSTPVNAVSLLLPIDENILTVEEVNISDSVIALWTQTPELKNGEILLEGGTTRRGFVGEHSIATITFTAKTSGMVTIEPRQVELVAGDGTGTITTLQTDKLPTTDVYITTADLVDASTNPYEQAIQEQLQITGKPGLADVSRFLSAWVDRDVIYDFNQDGRMTFRDFAIILAYVAR